MTQTTGTGQVFAVELSVTHALVTDLRFADLLDHVESLRALTVLGHAMIAGPHGQRVTPVSFAMLNTEKFTRIRSISYNSPLEIVLTLLGGTGAALAVANRIVSLHNRYQEARLIRSNVDTQIAVNDAVRAEIQARGIVFSEDAQELQPTIDTATKALSSITNIELIPLRQPD